MTAVGDENRGISGYGIGLEIPHDTLQQNAVGQIPYDEPPLEDSPVMAGGKVVVNHQFMARIAKGLDHMTPHIAGPAGDEDLHY